MHVKNMYSTPVMCVYCNNRPGCVSPPLSLVLSLSAYEIEGGDNGGGDGDTDFGK